MEPINSYPLSTEQNDIIPMDVAKPANFYWLHPNIAATSITFPEDDNNIVCITSDVLCFVSVNPAIDSVGDLVTNIANPGIYVITPNFSHILALPKDVKVFSAATEASKNIFIQQLIRWAAAGGQSISYGVS